MDFPSPSVVLNTGWTLVAYCRIKCTPLFIREVFFFFVCSQHRSTRHLEWKSEAKNLEKIKRCWKILDGFHGRNSSEFHEQLQRQLTFNVEAKRDEKIFLLPTESTEEQ